MVSEIITVVVLCALRQMKEWHLPLCLKKKMNKRKMVRKRKLHASDVRRSDTTPANAMRNCPPRHLRADEDSWNGNSDRDDNDDDGQYEQKEYDEEVEDAPPEAIQQSTQDHNNAETECDDVTTEDESEQGAYEGQFDDADFEGVMFAQNHVVCNVQEKAGIPKTWILLDSQSY